MKEDSFERSFLTLLVDSVILLENSLETQFELSSTYARGSILSSMLLPEVVCNICIDTLNLEKSIFREIDKLSVIGKFDFYLRTRFRNKKIERGISYVQGIQELKKLRDLFVHPKKYKLTWSPGENGEYTGQSEATPIFDISKNPNLWYSEDAIKTMRGVHDFLGYFFKTLCKFSATKVSGLLFSEDYTPDIENTLIPYLDRSVKFDLKDMNIDISYVKLGWH